MLEQAAEWLTPTNAWRLGRCSASAHYSGGPGAKPPSVVTNAGEAAHQALQAWVREFARGDPSRGLGEMFDRTCSAWGLSPESMPNGRLTRSRLAIRERELEELLASAGGQVQVDSERWIADGDRLIWGIPDLVVRGNQVILIDLKTGKVPAGGLDPGHQAQLLIYAHLIKHTSGQLPDRAVVFSLLRGAVDLTLSQEAIDQILGGLAAMRTGPRVASPSPHVCRFCDQRPRCDSHWSAQESWDSRERDGVAGTLVRADVAENGSVAVLLATPAGRAWVTHLPVVPPGTEPGVHLRIIGVHQPANPDAAWIAGPRATAHLQAGG